MCVHLASLRALTFPLGAIARKLAVLSVVVKRNGLSTTVGVPATVSHGYATILSKFPTVKYTCGEANDSSTARMEQPDSNKIYQRQAVILAPIKHNKRSSAQL